MISIGFLILVSVILLVLVEIAIFTSILSINGNIVNNSIINKKNKIIENQSNINETLDYVGSMDLDVFSHVELSGPITTGSINLVFYSEPGNNITNKNKNLNWIKHGEDLTLWWTDKDFGSFTIATETELTTTSTLPSGFKPIHNIVHPIRLLSNGGIKHNSYMLIGTDGKIHIYDNYANTAFSNGLVYMYSSSVTYKYQ